MKLAGLTGGIATGKSTVAKRLAEHGALVIDADRIARDILLPGTPGLQAVVDAFGPSALLPDGTLDRAAMRARLFEQPGAKRTLEAITHPRIAIQIAAEVHAGLAAGRFVIVEAALMVETGSYRSYPTLIVVTCAPATQLARLCERDQMPPDRAQALIDTQLPLTSKEAVATHLVRNDGDLAELLAATDALWQQLQRA